MTFVDQMTEHYSRFAGWTLTGDPRVVFFAAGPGLVLKRMILALENLFSQGLDFNSRGRVQMQNVSL